MRDEDVLDTSDVSHWCIDALARSGRRGGRVRDGQINDEVAGDEVF